MPRFHIGHAALLLTAALFGIAFIFQRHSATAVSALTFMSWRLPVSAAFLLAILALCRRPAWGHWLRDGIGPEIMQASRRVWDAAIRAAYGEARRIVWCELPLGEAAAGQ